MFIVALFTIDNTWKQPKCINRGMDKEDTHKHTHSHTHTHTHTHTMEYYSASKKNGIRPFVATWMDPECVILIEGSQS